MKHKKSVSQTFYRHEEPQSYRMKEKEKGLPTGEELNTPEGTSGWIGPRRYQSPYENTETKTPAQSLNSIPAPYNPTSGSGKVIPDRQNFQNKEDIQKFEKRAIAYQKLASFFIQKHIKELKNANN